MTKFVPREVRANLIEATPNPLGHWVLASPTILFFAWWFLDLFSALSPIPWRWLDTILGGLIFIFALILPLGLLAHRIITAFPGVFQKAGWDVQPLEAVSPAEMYSVKYLIQETQRATTTWNRLWVRAAQGWVYLEVFAIIVGFVALGPLYFSALNAGFGQ